MFKRKIRMIILLAITFMGSMIGLQNVDAATDKISAGEYVKGPYYYMHEKGSRSLWEQTSMIQRNSDGAFVYCVQPFVRIKSDATYEVTTEDMASVANISYENWKRIEKVAYYGYGYNENGVDHTNIRWYPATQMLIWKLADPTVDSFFTTSLRGQRDDSILANEMAEINRLVDSHTTTPNFTDVPSEMVIGNTITINDSNNVLSNYNIENVVGGNVSKNGNSLNITATQVGDITFNLTKNGNRYGEPTRLYYATDSQNVVRRGNIDPVRKPMKIKVIGGTVTPNKLDDETLTNVPQGTESSLEGAVYGIFKEDGTKVGTVTTGADGRVTSDYLPSLGRFYLLEEKPSKGYLLDKNKYYFELTTTNLYPEVQVFEKVISLDFDFTKVYADDKTGIMTPEVGVVFGIYNNKNEEVRRLTTDEQGNIKFKLPYGSYTVKQLTSTPGHEKAKDFTLEVRETGPVVKKVIANAEIHAKLKVVKIDSETKEVIKRSNIKFKIYDTKKKEYVCQTVSYPEKKTYCEFSTDENGEFMTPYMLDSGTYRLEEIDQKIDGYLWNKISQEFTIDENSELITDSIYGIVFSTEFANQPVKGEVQIKKTGETVTITDKGFEYSTKSLEGVLFGLYAADNVVINDKIVITKGTKVAERRTDKDGNITFDKLYLGKYYIQEIATLDHYVLDENKYEFELKYKDQYTPVILYSKAIMNILKTGKLEFTKTDISESKTLPNTLIEIYTEDDKLVFSGRTDENGKIVIDKIPQGKYYILEKEAPEGYKINEEKIPFEIKENGDIIKATMKDDDITGTLEFTKVDISTGEPLPNTLIEIYTESDELVFSGRTDENGKITIENLKYGKYYLLEKEAPEGYEINPDKMYFEIKSDGEIVKFVMKDEKIIDVPITDKTDYKEVIIAGAILMLVGTGIVIYGNKKKRK